MSKLPLDGNVRPEVADSLRHLDKWGGEMPRRLGAFPLLGVAVAAGVPCRAVPDDYWRPASGVGGGHYSQAIIDCVCGATTTLELGCGPDPCAGLCGRWFFYAGPQVLALGAPSR